MADSSRAPRDSKDSSPRARSAPTLPQIAAAVSDVLAKQSELQEKLIRGIVREELSKVNKSRLDGNAAPNATKPPPGRPPSRRGPMAAGMALAAKDPSAAGEQTYTTLCTGDLISLRVGGKPPPPPPSPSARELF
jgi:hypothetical protein